MHSFSLWFREHKNIRVRPRKPDGGVATEVLEKIL